MASHRTVLPVQTVTHGASGECSGFPTHLFAVCPQGRRPLIAGRHFFRDFDCILNLLEFRAAQADTAGVHYHHLGALDYRRGNILILQSLDKMAQLLRHVGCQRSMRIKAHIGASLFFLIADSLNREQLAQARKLVIYLAMPQAGPKACLMAGDDGHSQILFQNLD